MSSQTKLFGVKIHHSSEDVPLSGMYNGGIIIHRKILSNPTENKKGFFEYKVSYGQGQREV